MIGQENKKNTTNKNLNKFRSISSSYSSEKLRIASIGYDKALSPFLKYIT